MQGNYKVLAFLGNTLPSTSKQLPGFLFKCMSMENVCCSTVLITLTKPALLTHARLPNM